MKKILNEWRKYLKENIGTMPSSEIEQHRIMISERIFDTLQKPSRRRAEFPQELPFLYYLYKGVSPVKNSEGKIVKYKILNQSNAGAVMNEIQKRVDMFLVALDPPEDKIFASDALMIGKYLHQNKDKQVKGLSSAYGVSSPGEFDTFIFGKARRSFFQPFKKDIDFMLKKSPELRNIPESDRYLFEFDTMIAEILKKIKRDPKQSIPPLTEDQFIANYLEGIQLKTWQKIQDDIVTDPTPDQAIGSSLLFSLESMIKNMEDIRDGKVTGIEAEEAKKDIAIAITSPTFSGPALMKHPKYRELLSLAGLVGVWQT